MESPRLLHQHSPVHVRRQQWPSWPIPQNGQRRPRRPLESPRSRSRTEPVIPSAPRRPLPVSGLLMPQRPTRHTRKDSIPGPGGLPPSSPRTRYEIQPRRRWRSPRFEPRETHPPQLCHPLQLPADPVVLPPAHTSPADSEQTAPTRRSSDPTFAPRWSGQFTSDASGRRR